MDYNDDDDDDERGSAIPGHDSRSHKGTLNITEKKSGIEWAVVISFAWSQTQILLKINQMLGFNIGLFPKSCYRRKFCLRFKISHW